MSRRIFSALLLALALLPAPAALADSTPRPAAPPREAAGAAPEAGTGRYPLSSARAQQAMAVTANPHATDAALEILRQGGGAVDAAIAAQAVLGLVEPQSSGFGGGAFLVYHDGKQVLAYDGREVAPMSATPERFLRTDGSAMDFHEAIASGRAIGVPGVLAMLEKAHRAHGRLPWRKLFLPATRLARAGFTVSPRLHALIARDPLLKTEPTARAYFFNADGEPWPVGHLLTNPAYADTLERIARGGAFAFYRSPFTAKLINALNAEGADFTPADWRDYQVRVTPALCAPYRRWRVCSAPPPAGGLTVLQTLRLLDGFAWGPDTALNLHRLLEAERLAFADRQRYSADPAFVRVPVAALLHEDYLGKRRALIGDTSMKRAEAGVPPGVEDDLAMDGQVLEHGTTQLVIADRKGHWLSMTSSIEDAFGSRVMAGGMLFNNELTDFSFRPVEDGRAVANRVGAGKRPRSAMAPVLVLDRDGKPVLALGSPGGSRIIGYVLRTLTAVLDDGLAPAQAVAAPLVLSRNGPTEIDADFPAALRAALEARGHDITQADLNSGIALIRRGKASAEGAADPRREGRASGF